MAKQAIYQRNFLHQIWGRLVAIYGSTATVRWGLYTFRYNFPKLFGYESVWKNSQTSSKGDGHQTCSPAIFASAYQSSQTGKLNFKKYLCWSSSVGSQRSCEQWHSFHPLSQWCTSSLWRLFAAFHQPKVFGMHLPPALLGWLIPNPYHTLPCTSHKSALLAHAWAWELHASWPSPVPVRYPLPSFLLWNPDSRCHPSHVQTLSPSKTSSLMRFAWHRTASVRNAGIHAIQDAPGLTKIRTRGDWSYILNYGHTGQPYRCAMSWVIWHALRRFGVHRGS